MISPRQAAALCAWLVSAPLAALAGGAKLDRSHEQLELPYVERHAEDPVALAVLPGGVPGAPVLVFFHGGGWSRGDKSDLLAFGRRLAAQGVNVLLPNYRLAPDYLFPAQAEDAAAAVAFALRHVKDLGADKRCVFTGGVAAGAHLAAIIATHPRFFEKAKVKPKDVAGVIAVDGVYRIVATEGGATQQFLGAVFGFDELTWRYASPIELVPPAAERRLPPVAVIWNRGERTVIVKDSEQFLQKLQAAGQAAVAIARDGEPLDAIDAALFGTLSQGACAVHR